MSQIIFNFQKKNYDFHSKKNIQPQKTLKNKANNSFELLMQLTTMTRFLFALLCLSQILNIKSQATEPNSIPAPTSPPDTLQVASSPTSGYNPPSTSGPFLVNYNTSFQSWVQGTPQVFSNSTNYEIIWQGETEIDPDLNNTLQVYRNVYSSEGDLIEGPQLILKNQTIPAVTKFVPLPNQTLAGKVANTFIIPPPIPLVKTGSQSSGQSTNQTEKETANQSVNQATSQIVISPPIFFNNEQEVLIWNSQFEIVQNISVYNSNLEVAPLNQGFILFGYNYNQFLNVTIYNSEFNFESTFQIIQPSICLGSLSFSSNIPFILNNTELILIWNCYSSTSQSFIGSSNLQNGTLIKSVPFPYSLGSPILTQINSNSFAVTWYGNTIHNYAQINTMVFNQELQNITGLIVVNKKETFSVINSNINVLPLNSNRFTIVWSSNNNGYYNQRSALWIQTFDTLGNLEGANVELTTFNQSYMYNYAVASSGNSIMVAWPGFQNFEIYAQVFPIT